MDGKECERASLSPLLLLSWWLVGERTASFGEEEVEVEVGQGQRGREG